MTPDNELLRRYAQTRSEEAFTELVRRHVNLVYSAALRQVGSDAHLAQDVAQTVFTDLARKAGSLARRESVTGWLYTSAHFAAAKMARTENRRRDREDKFMREPISETAPEADWETIRPVLDDVMHELNESDREAILLRYFENRQFAEVGAKLGLNENSARMRVERALEKLRAIFAKRGIATAAALASVISANAVQMAPAGLTATLTTTSIAAAGSGTTFALLKFMTATHIKLGLSALVVAGAATAMVVQHQTRTRLRDESELLRQQIAELKTDNQSLSNRLASIGEANTLTDEQFNELMRLRAEVGQLRQQTNLLAQSVATLEGENHQLQFQLEAAERQAVEKFPMLTNVIAFREHQLALISAAKQIGIAMRMYGNDNGGVYPTNFEEITRYFSNTNFPAFEAWPTPNSSTNFSGTIGLSDFEMVNLGLASEQIPQIPAVKERQPLWWDGQWECVYLMADGAVQVITSNNGDFSAWEKKQLALALGTTNQ